MQGFNRAQTRQMGQLYGKQGLLIEQWSDDLKQPGTQAAIIAVFSVLCLPAVFISPDCWTMMTKPADQTHRPSRFDFSSINSRSSIKPS